MEIFSVWFFQFFQFSRQLEIPVSRPPHLTFQYVSSHISVDKIQVVLLQWAFPTHSYFLMLEDALWGLLQVLSILLVFVSFILLDFSLGVIQENLNLFCNPHLLTRELLKAHCPLLLFLLFIFFLCVMSSNKFAKKELRGSLFWFCVFKFEFLKCLYPCVQMTVCLRREFWLKIHFLQDVGSMSSFPSSSQDCQWLSGEGSLSQAGDASSISLLGSSPGGESGNPLQYSCLGNPMDGEAWWTVVHGVARELDRIQ